MDFIKIPSPDSHRIYVPKFVAANPFLAAATLWQDRELDYQGKVWLGYELLAGTEVPILELLHKLFGAEDVTEKFFNSLAYNFGPK
jgi:hypothetical protein